MEFDLNALRSVITVLAFISFIWLVVWTWSRRRQAAYDEAAQMPLLEDEPVPGATEQH